MAIILLTRIDVKVLYGNKKNVLHIGCYIMHRIVWELRVFVGLQINFQLLNKSYMLLFHPQESYTIIIKFCILKDVKKFKFDFSPLRVTKGYLNQGIILIDLKRKYLNIFAMKHTNSTGLYNQAPFLSNYLSFPFT